jgi:transcriptional regulator with XRE-family HTH domain
MMQGSLAEKLRVLRARQGLTLIEAAEKTGVGRDTLSNLERGRSHPVMPTLAKIAKGYGVPVEELLEEDVITFDNDAVRAAITAAKAGKLTTREAAQAIADSVRGGPADALEDALELLLEHAEASRDNRGVRMLAD